MEIMENKNIVNDKEMFCYQHNSFYVFSLPKIASSWLYQFFKKLNGYDDDSELFNASPIFFNENSLNINVNENADINSFTSSDILDDWNKQKLGIETNRDFIFLMRNPIDKYFGGIMQDVILPFLDINTPDNLEIINAYPNKEELVKFLEYNNIEKNTDRQWYLYLKDAPTHICNVIQYLIDIYVDKFFSNPESINQYRDGHKTSNLFLYYKILFNSNFNKNKIRIVDIDFEDINSILTTKYNLNISLTDIINKTDVTFKNIVERSIIRYISYVSILIETDLLLYCDILHKVYNVNVVPNQLWNSKLKKINEK